MKRILPLVVIAIFLTLLLQSSGCAGRNAGTMPTSTPVPTPTATPTPVPTPVPTPKPTPPASASDGAQSVQQTSDGGYIIAVYTESYGADGGDVYVVKTDARGKEHWSQTYGGSATPN